MENREIYDQTTDREHNEVQTDNYDYINLKSFAQRIPIQQRFGMKQKTGKEFFN